MARTRASAGCLAAPIVVATSGLPQPCTSSRWLSGVVPRAEHTISRQQIDPDALRVLYGCIRTAHAYLLAARARLLLGPRRKTSTSHVGAPSSHRCSARWIIAAVHRRGPALRPKTIDALLSRQLAKAELDAAAESETTSRPPQNPGHAQPGADVYLAVTA